MGEVELYEKLIELKAKADDRGFKDICARFTIEELDILLLLCYRTIK